MAKKTKIQIELDKTKKNWNEIEKLVISNKSGNYSNTFVNLFIDNKETKLRKILIENKLPHLTRAATHLVSEHRDTISQELKKSIYKESLEKFLSDGRRCFEQNDKPFLIELVNHHKLKISPVLLNQLKYFGEVFGVDNEDFKKYLAANPNDLNVNTILFVLDNLDKECLCNFLNKLHNKDCNTQEKKDNLKKVVEKISFEEYITWFKKNHNFWLPICVLTLYPAETVVSTLLKKNLNFGMYENFNTVRKDEEDIPTEEKIKLTIEEANILLKHCEYSHLSKAFSFEMSDATFGEFLKTVYDGFKPYSDKINEFILKGYVAQLKLFFHWDEITLTPETAKILFHKSKHKSFRNNCGRFRFDRYRKYITQEEVDTIVNDKKELVKHIDEKAKVLYNKLKEIKINHKNENVDCVDDNCNWHQSPHNKEFNKLNNRLYKYRQLINRIVKEYEIDFQYVISLIGEIDNEINIKINETICNSLYRN